MAVLDASTGRPIGRPIQVGASPVGIAYGDGKVWVANAADDTVSVIDAATMQVIGDPIQVGPEPVNVQFADHRLYVPNARGNTVSVISTSSREVVEDVACQGGVPSDAISAAGRDYILSAKANTVEVFEPRANTYSSIEVDPNPIHVTVGLGYVWVSSYGKDGDGDTVSVIDTKTGAPVSPSIKVPRGPGQIAIAAGRAWVAAGNSLVPLTPPSA